jgi:Trypsin-co-occurring domain 1
MDYLEINVGGSHPLVVEYESADEIVEASRVHDVAQRGIQTFEEAMDSLRDAAERAVARVTSLAPRPDQVTVQFSVQLGTEAGVVIARAAASANMSVTLMWGGNGKGTDNGEH